jgi:hypothetical protein
MVLLDRQREACFLATAIRRNELKLELKCQSNLIIVLPPARA